MGSAPGKAGTYSRSLPDAHAEAEIHFQKVQWIGSEGVGRSEHRDAWLQLLGSEKSGKKPQPVEKHRKDQCFDRCDQRGTIIRFGLSLDQLFLHGGGLFQLFSANRDAAETAGH